MNPIPLRNYISNKEENKKAISLYSATIAPYSGYHGYHFNLYPAPYLNP